MSSFVTWGVVGALVGAALLGLFATIWNDPERTRKRRAKANQKWVRDRLAKQFQEEAELIIGFRAQMEDDPWKHLESK